MRSQRAGLNPGSCGGAVISLQPPCCCLTGPSPTNSLRSLEGTGVTAGVFYGCWNQLSGFNQIVKRSEVQSGSHQAAVKVYLHGGNPAGDSSQESVSLPSSASRDHLHCLACDPLPTPKTVMAVRIFLTPTFLPSSSIFKRTFVLHWGLPR